MIMISIDNHMDESAIGEKIALATGKKHTRCYLNCCKCNCSKITLLPCDYLLIVMIYLH